MIPFFVINVWKNADQAQKLSAKLTSLYPQSSVCLISDETEHLKTQDKAGAWTERWLKAFVGDGLLYPGVNVCIKVDPDVTPYKAVTEFPEADVFGAQHIFRDGSFMVLGGAMGITRQAAQKILDSGFLHDKKYTGDEYTYPSKGAMVSLQDKIVSDIIVRLKLKVGHWHDVYAHVRQAPQNPASYAFVNEFIS